MRLEAAYEKYADMLYRLALSHMNHREDAEDVVQEVFVRYLNHTKEFGDEEHERAWLIRVTVNACYDALRHKSHRNHSALEDVTEIAASEDATDSGVIQMMSQLPVKMRTVLVLYYLEGFAIDEIASMLHISASAVKMRMSRGREQLKTIMEKEEADV